MARITNREADSPPPKSRRRTMLCGRAEQQVENGHGPDPWGVAKYGEDAAGSTWSAGNGTESARRGLKTNFGSQLVSHSEGRGQGNTAQSESATANSEAPGDEDDVALPTPIHATVPWKIVHPDGRSVEVVRTAIHGFEHLFDDAGGFQEAPSTDGPSSTVPRGTVQPQHDQAPGTPHHTPAHDGTQQPRSKSVHGIKVPSKKKTVLKTTKRNVLKRTRSVAQGLAQPSSACQAAGKHGKHGNTDAGEDEEAVDSEVAVVTERSKTFHIGDVDALTTFIRHRIDELTMKPVRGIVTTWLKQLEPKRKGGYGPYHKRLPSEAPVDATPPWWPRSVPYVEPAHLDKDGLMTLAVDIMMQHRDIPIDRFKRSQSWTYKLRQVAQFETEMTPVDHFSSSRNAEFSALMKERAEKDILPSLFDVSQSYEDHVNQYQLWTYKNTKDAPKGKSITWQFIPRPRKQVSRTKRSRPAPQPKVKREELLEALVENSGDETEVDDTMFKLVEQLMRKQEARRKAKATAESTPPNIQVPPACPVSRGRTIEAPSPTVADESFPATPHLQPQPLQDSNMDDTKLLMSNSFDQSMDHLQLQDGASRGSFLLHDHRVQAAHYAAEPPRQLLQLNASATERPAISFQRNHGDVKGGLVSSVGQGHEARRATQESDEVMLYHTPPAIYTNTILKVERDDAQPGLSMVPTSQNQQTHGELQMLEQRIDYHGAQPRFIDDPYPSPQGTGTFPGQQGSLYPQFMHQDYIDPAQLSVYNSMTPQMSHYNDPSMASNNMPMAYPYGQDGSFNPMEASMSGAPSLPAVTSFTGLPFEYSGSQH